MLLQIIRFLVSDAEVVIHGTPTNADEYANQVIWLDDRPQPSWSDIEAAQSTVETQQARAEVEQQRSAAYRQESDPLFFEWQRGEGSEQAWRDKVEEIRQRYPYPT